MLQKAQNTHRERNFAKIVARLHSTVSDLHDTVEKNEQQKIEYKSIQSAILNEIKTWTQRICSKWNEMEEKLNERKVKLYAQNDEIG